MVIISKDDYLSFLNEFGGKMQTPPAANVNNTQNSTSPIPINKFYNDQSQQSSGQTLQQQQQQQTPPQLQTHIERLREVMQESTNKQTNVNNGNNKVLQTARAILICRPNSHPFQNRTLFLEPNVEVKVGRSVARTKVSETNAIFDCKVLSRNHAVIWYYDGKFFLKDTGSSNGTFINNNRLSPTTVQSEPFEVSSGDIVQFGVDVMENSRKETHGCIVATLKLFLPDGRETKASHSTLVGAVSTNIEPSDLYRLNQFVQEIVQRDQIMETKLMNIQKTVDKTRKNSSQGWQALIDEDRLLSRIDMLEKKLQCMQKNVSEDKLREEVLKLQEEKLIYETSAKETLRKVYQERSEAIQRLTAIQRALCTSENECSLLREQISKLNSHIQDLTDKLSTVQKQFDEKINEAQEKESSREIEIKGLKDDVKTLQERIVLLQENCDSDESETGRKSIYSKNPDMISLMLGDSNIMKMKDSLEIINAICNENENNDGNVEETKFLELDSTTSKIYKKIINLELILNTMEQSNRRTVCLPNDSNIQIKNSNSQENNSLQVENNTSSVVCDGNQNLNSSALLATSTDFKLLKKSIKLIKNSFIDLIKMQHYANVEQSGTKDDEQDKQKSIEETGEESEKVKRLENELESRPSMEEYKEKVDLIDELNDKLTLSETENLAFKLELSNNKAKIESLQEELTTMKKDTIPSISTSTADANVQTLSLSNDKAIIEPSKALKEESGSSVEEINSSSSDEVTKELNIIHHPDVEREEELVLFKEKYTKLVEEKLSIDQQLIQLREDYQQYRNKSMTHLLMYLAPIFALIAYLFIHYCN